MEWKVQLHAQGHWCCNESQVHPSLQSHPPCCGAVTSHKSIPPYSSNLTLHDFHLFGPFKKHLPDKQFAADTDVKQAVTFWLQKLNTSFFFASYKSFCHDGTKVWIAMVTKSESDVYCALHLHPVYTEDRIIFLASECLLPYFETSLCIQPIQQHSWLSHSIL